MWEINCFLRNIGKIRMASFTCSHFGRWNRHEANFKRHVKSSHTSQPPYSCDHCGRSFNRVDNLQNHLRDCTDRSVVTTVTAATTVPAAKKRCTGHGVTPERLQLKVERQVKHWKVIYNNSL